jgi:plastocyanin
VTTPNATPAASHREQLITALLVGTVVIVLLAVRSTIARGDTLPFPEVPLRVGSGAMRLIPLGLAVLVGLAASTFGASGAVAAPTAHAVMISGFAFQPAALASHAGDAMTWTNHDTAPHDVTVTSGPVTFHSLTITTRQSWSHTFATVGSYAYICSIHPDMHAALTVAAVPTSPARVRSTHATAVSATPRRSKAAPAPATSSTAPVVAAPIATSGTPSHPLKPLLLVAGIVAAVATLCLLLLASHSDVASPG